MTGLVWLLQAPAWAKVALGSLLIVGYLQFSYWRETRGLHHQIDAATHALETERLTTAQLKVGLADVSANRDALRAQVRLQNEAVDALQAKSSALTRQLQSERALRATEVLRAQAAVSEALRKPATLPPGHDAINSWIRDAVKR